MAMDSRMSRLWAPATSGTCPDATSAMVRITHRLTHHGHHRLGHTVAAGATAALFDEARNGHVDAVPQRLGLVVATGFKQLPHTELVRRECLRRVVDVPTATIPMAADRLK